MRGKSRSSAQEAYHDAVACYGCVACRQEYLFNPMVSIHHVDGRTKPHAHWLVLPLCAGHHQQGTDGDASKTAVHPYKWRFEQLYGSQFELYEGMIKDLKMMYDFVANGWKVVVKNGQFYGVKQ